MYEQYLPEDYEYPDYFLSPMESSHKDQFIHIWDEFRKSKEFTTKQNAIRKSVDDEVMRFCNAYWDLGVSEDRKKEFTTVDLETSNNMINDEAVIVYNKILTDEVDCYCIQAVQSLLKEEAFGMTEFIILGRIIFYLSLARTFWTLDNLDDGDDRDIFIRRR